MSIGGNVLVTGGAGFIGSHLVDALMKNRDVKEVRVIDNFSTGKIENISNHLKSKKFSLLKDDVRNHEAVHKAMKNINYVFHEAAIASVPLSVKNPQACYEVNVAGTLNLLEEARIRDAILIYASSCAVYGDPSRIPIREDDASKPISPYGASKLSAEALCIAYNSTYGLRSTCLRYFNVYGPRQSYNRYSGVITIFTNRALRGEDLIIYGDGKQTRDFIYVKDIVDANLLIANCKRAYGQVFNVGTGKETSIKSLALKIIKIVGTDVKIIHKAPIKGDIRRSVADISHIKEIANYSPKISLNEGLSSFIKYISSHKLAGDI
ncbi:nucleoside-diphosphate sugar epimerase [Candidatus Bathyarchaeota archaeon]|nr:MAG: nucleoside-diphosphate sugar epimerase [Candidatus Bathyarchaeota archaeon]